MKAIVYNSNTGFTEKYAKLLAENTGLSCYSVLQAEDALCKDDEIIYLSRVCAGKIAGLAKALKKYRVKAICAVGMTAPGEEIISQLKSNNNIGDIAFFYLRGGFDYNKLRGFDKFAMKLLRPMLIKELKSKKDKDSAETVKALQNGGDWVREINLKNIIVWYHKNK